MSYEIEGAFQRAGYIVTRLVSRLASYPRSHRRWMAVAMDSFICLVAAILSLYLRTGSWSLFDLPLLILVGCALAFWFPIAWARSTYLSLLRFSGGRTMMGLGIATGIFAVPMVIVFMFLTVPGVPRTIGLLHPIIFLALLCVSRLAIRFALVDILGGGVGRIGRDRRRVAIYGAGRAGQQLAMALRHESQVHLVSFIDDDTRLNNQVLDGVKIRARGDLDINLQALAVDEILLAIPSAPRTRRRDILRSLSARNVTVRYLPSVGKIIGGEVSVNDLREIQVEELLGRDPVPPNEVLLSRNIAGKVVMVTGAGGSIGSELCRQIMQSRPARLVLLEQSEFGLYSIGKELVEQAQRLNSGIAIVQELCDVADRDAISRVMRKIAPDTVFHAAAYKHVPLVELNPLEGLRNNVFGTLNTVQAAEDARVRNFILISTDKAVRPTNVMGASKRVCEMILQARAANGANTNFSMVRFGNVLGSSGSVVPLFKDQIKAGGPITVTDRRVTRYFMTIPEAAQLVIQAGAMSKGGEVFVLEMGEPIRIIDLAVTMIRLYGLCEITPENPNGDIEIVEVGLRPGEKLYEELLIGKNPQKTSHERIIKAHESHVGWHSLDGCLGDLRECLRGGDLLQAMAIIRGLVPEYVSESVDIEAAVG